MATRLPQPTTVQWVLIASAAACYLVGYPLALAGRSPVGWIFVSLGGFVLLALATLTIMRVHHGNSGSEGRE